MWTEFQSVIDSIQAVNNQLHIEIEDPFLYDPPMETSVHAAIVHSADMRVTKYSAGRRLVLFHMEQMPVSSYVRVFLQLSMVPAVLTRRIRPMSG